MIVDISEHWDVKQRAIEAYRSQFVDNQPEAGPTLIDRLREMAATWGFAIGARYGEPLATREPLGLRSFDGLK
jgi:LmbE family N-acetylglucosaminyl deacetylase